MDFKDVAIDASVASLASKATYSGALAGILGWVSSLDWLTIVGVLVAVSGLVTNIHFQRRRDKRETELTRARIEALKQNGIS